MKHVSQFHRRAVAITCNGIMARHALRIARHEASAKAASWHSRNLLHTVQNCTYYCILTNFMYVVWSSRSAIHQRETWMTRVKTNKKQQRERKNKKNKKKTTAASLAVNHLQMKLELQQRLNWPCPSMKQMRLNTLAEKTPKCSRWLGCKNRRECIDHNQQPSDASDATSGQPAYYRQRLVVGRPWRSSH